MEDLKTMTDDALRRRLLELASDERTALVNLLRHLAEWDRRETLLELGFSSLYDYCTRELRYSEDAAVQRIMVARAGARFPKVLCLLQSARLSLTAAATLAPHLSAFNADYLLDRAVGLSVKEVRALAAAQSPQKERPDFIKPLSPGRNLFSFTGSDDLLRKLERGKELLWHKFPGGRLEHVIEQALDDMLLKRDPALREARRSSRTDAGRGGRHVARAVRLEVWRRDGGRCAFVGQAGRRCAETSGLELDHVRPFALGGEPTLDNLRLLCRAHNQLHAREVFGDAAARHLRH